MELVVVGGYLAAIVAANLVSATYGPTASVVSAFILIGINFALRDVLHLQWEGRGLALRMGALILTGAAVSYLINGDAAPVAVASSVAFLAAESADALVFHRLKGLSHLRRANGSNLLSSAIDSLVFPTIAFGGLMPMVVLGQYIAKVGGGYLWSIALRSVPSRPMSSGVSPASDPRTF